MKVKNINGTSGNSCQCASWLAHWENFSSQKAVLCVEKTCTEKAAAGAHVQKNSATDSAWYIVPLCAKHNKQAGEVELYGTPVLAPANVSQTCGK